MARMTMCIQCGEMIERGWAMFNHAKQCRGRKKPPNNVGKANQRAKANDGFTDKHTDQLQHDDSEEEPRQGKRQRLEESDCTDLHLVGQQFSKQKSRVTLGPKTREILEFLGTAEMGEGCSREHAQGWLNYHKRKGGVSANLLPKDIRTCWKHVAEVKFLHAVLPLHT